MLLDIISHRSDRHFKSFLYALVDVDQDDFAMELDRNIAVEFIRQRNVKRENTQGMVSVLIDVFVVLKLFVFL